MFPITKEHNINRKKPSLRFYNRKKQNLAGTGMILIAMMKYRIEESGDKSYDEYIKKIYKTSIIKNL